MDSAPRNQSQRLKTIALPGTLSLGHLLRLFPCFVPAKSGDDPLQLGWRLADPGGWPAITTSRLEKMSAEAVAALGAMRGAFPENITQTLTTKPTSHSACERVLNGLRPESDCWEPLRSGGASLLLREVNVSTVDDVERISDIVVNDLLKAPGEGGRGLGPLREVLRRLLTEALMNVHEHAYQKGRMARAWLAAVCIPSATVHKVHSGDDLFAEEEKEWLKTIDGRQVLELAIADSGVGIAATLSPSAASLVPSLVKAAKEMTSGRREFGQLRAKIHAELCGYAFYHSSTSKGTDLKKFPSEHHKLNWRGLYRCYRQVAELGGGISLTSGRGRAGYTATPHGAVSFETEISIKGEYPGTLMSVRLPIPAWPRPAPTAGNKTGSAALEIYSSTIRWDEVVVGKPRSVSSGPTKVSVRTEFACVALPFVELTVEPDPSKEHLLPIQKLRIALDHLQQDLVPVFCFGTAHEDWREHLRAFVESTSWHPTLHGPPRLVGLLGTNGVIQWVFAGAIPLAAEYALLQFERNGMWEMPAHIADEVHKLFTEISAHYRDILTWNPKTRVFRLHTHSARLHADSYRDVLQAAFTQYWRRASVKSEVVTEVSGKVILLPNGTQLRRHFSVFKLLNQSPDLTIALGRRFGDLVRETIPPEHGIVVLDQPASSYIAHALIEGADIKIEVVTLDQLLRCELAKPTILLFADCIFKGNTAKGVLEELQRLGFQVARVIVCADFRPDRSVKSLGGVPFASLICPNDVEGELVTESLDETNIIRTDSLTQVPVLEATRSSFVELTEHEERRRLIASESNLFCVGFQFRGGRTHTYTLPLSGLIEKNDGKQRLAGWVCEMVGKLLESMGLKVSGKDVVLFTWFESRMSSIVEHLAERLREPPCSANGIFVIRMPVAHRGSDAIYPHSGTNPIIGCSEVATGRFPFATRRTPKPAYVAIYLADSAVTGNSLRDFLHRLVIAARPEPAAAIAIIGVNRLSPAETRFFSLCPVLTRPNTGSTLPFAQGSLFTLQIRSRAREVSVWHPLLEAVFSDPALRVAQLRDYIEKLQLRTAKLNANKGLCHLFCPIEKPFPVSADAVHLRHLLALNQQNEPLVLEILTLLKRLTAEDTDDPSVLVVLALEPNLLLDSPLRNFGRESLVRMARRILTTSDASIAVKTDALVVLASFPSAMQKHFYAVAECVLADETLRLTTVALLLALQRLRGQSAQALIESSFTHISPEARLHADQLCHLLAVCTDIQGANFQPEREKELRQVVEHLICHLMHHAAALEIEWDGVGTNLDVLANRWTVVAKPPRRVATAQACRRSIVFANKTLVPAFHALAYFARGYGDPELASALEDQAVRARELLAEFAMYIPKKPETMTQSDAKSLEAAYQALRSATWFGSTSERLLRGETPQPGSGPLADSLPRLFSAPADLLVLLADEVFQTTTEIENVAEMTGQKAQPWLTVAPVPVRALRHIFNLLLTNIRKYGVVKGIKVKQSTSAASGGTQLWALEMINSIRTGSPTGERQGLETARGAGAPFGIEVESRELDSRTWRTVIRIPRCFRLHKLTESRLP